MVGNLVLVDDMAQGGGIHCVIESLLGAVKKKLGEIQNLRWACEVSHGP